jgi:SAM-dependent methyltransferase
VSEPRMTLHAKMLGHGADGEQASVFLESLLMAQIALVLSRLGIPDLIAAGPRPVADLAAEAGADANALGRVLAAAAVYGLVRRNNVGLYVLTGTGELFRTDAEGSARNLAAGFLGPPMWMVGSNITEVVTTGKVNPAAPGGLYEHYGKHPEEALWFGRAMSRVTETMVAELAASAFRPLASGRIVDLGGGRGTLLGYLLGADHDATGVVFDRAEALAEAPRVLAGAGVSGRAECLPGDFLREVPPGDLYVLSQTLHNWADEQVLAVLGHCRKAGRPGNSIMVIELMLPDGPEPSVAHLMDLIMLTTLGGRERTRAQHEELMAEEGYRLVRDTPLARVLPWRILEFQHG